MDDNNKVIGNFIRQLREEKKLSQEKLAEQIPIDRTVVNKWETGRNAIPIDHVKTLSRIFNVTTDEILMGERMTPENKEKFENFHWDLFYKNNRFGKVIKGLIILILIVLLSFLAYYFVNNYNSIHVYKISSDSELFTINNGLFITSREKVYFELNNDYLIQKEKIEKVKLCYEIDKNKKCILETSDLDKVSFVDYYGYEEYLDFKKIKEIMNKMSFVLVFNDGSEVSSKLDFTKDYANNKILVDKKDKNGEINNVSDSGKDYFDEINAKFIDYAKSSDNDVFTYKLDDVEYMIYYDKISVNIEYYDVENKIMISFNHNAHNVLYVSLYKNDEYLNSICNYSFSKNECLIDNCDSCSIYVDIYKKVIDGFLKNN